MALHLSDNEGLVWGGFWLMMFGTPSLIRRVIDNGKRIHDDSVTRSELRDSKLMCSVRSIRAGFKLFGEEHR